ncbi:MAG: DUF2442 domain-containing protein [Candidatus Riflebacteria bacterium]|nr:DUF2442 domain-containing protein [Candidatus Riflebacteria bacterium]
MNPYVMQVRPLPDHLLEIVFDNGEVRVFDVKPFLDRGDFSRLKRDDVWRTVRVVAGSVEWDGGLDLSYDTLYLLGVPLPQMGFHPLPEPDDHPSPGVAEPSPGYGGKARPD